MLHFSAEEKTKLAELRRREAETLAQTMAARYKLLYLDLSKIPINTDALRLIPETEARQANAAAFKIVGKTVHLAILSPQNPKVQTIIEDLENKNFKTIIYLCSPDSLERAFSRYREVSNAARVKAGVVDISNEAINEIISQIKTLTDFKNLFENESQEAEKAGGVSGLLEVILAGGIVVEASDIHIEPQEQMVRLRYRLDGMLHDIVFLKRLIYERLLSRVKLISGLKLNIQRAAQDGRFSIKLADAEMEIRASVLPGAYGESIVLRLLNPKTILIEFGDLGMEERLRQVVEREINKPNGMILLTGPTGSGKTTSLYAFLRLINKEDVKIITIEDPIEYHLTGINQTQVNPAKNYTFLSGLRSSLRQDPDIIMIGEIRDKETAKTAIHAALTGHLVFSTIHTNNAAGTIPRLIDLEVNPKILDSALNISLAQRLVRRLCLNCRTASEPTFEEKELISRVFESIKQKRSEWQAPEQWQIYRPRENGCDRCRYTGYRGRIGVFEAVLMNREIAALITSNPNEREIKRAAKEQGMLDMREDGIIKVVNGVTALNELARVVDLNEEFL